MQVQGGVNIINMYGMNRREYGEYHEGYDHSAHTHEGYNFGAYGRKDCDEKWRYLRSMNAFYGNGSYGDESMVERSEFPFVRNFGEPSKNQEERLSYNSIKTISFFHFNSYLCFEIYFKEIKLFSLIFIEHGHHFTFLNSLGTYFERRYFIEFNSISCAIPRVDDYDFNIANCVSCVLAVEDRSSIEKELGPILEHLAISVSLNPSSLCYEVSLEELKSLLDSYIFQVSLIGDMCIIAFKGNLFLLVPSMSNFLSSHFSLEDPLMGSNVMFGPSCYGFSNLDDTSFVELNLIVFGNGVFELNLKNLIEKHFVYSIAFIDLLFKDEALNESIVQNTKSCVKIENQSLGATLLYSLTFKKFLDELNFRRELKVPQVLMLNQEFPLLNSFLKLFWKNLHQIFLFYYLPFKEIFWKHDLGKEQNNTFNYASFWRILVNFEWLFNSPFWSFLALKFFVYTSFSYRRPFKEICYLWNFYGVETLADKLDALFAYSLLSLKCLGNFHSVVPFNASISNVAHLLWLLEGMDSRMNPFKGEVDDMTQDAQETIELLQGLVTRAMARRMGEEHPRKIAIFKKMIQDLAWQVIGAQEGSSSFKTKQSRRLEPYRRRPSPESGSHISWFTRRLIIATATATASLSYTTDDLRNLTKNDNSIQAMAQAEQAPTNLTTFYERMRKSIKT
ncbi:hypothetical protein M9H77_12701 [Catharanthus roseus]|uniref:Uncharacterized protein n=1 Tax=Catharanthus roseus TaxID=4058 RepID=A0ACC0BI59_CATRO|nr:hypothetical protein M9H77_12701 [Catharanthus roseus]